MSVLLMAHRDLLIKQLAGHVTARGKTYSIEQGTHRARLDADAVIATVQSLNSSRECKNLDEEGIHRLECNRCIDGRIYRMQRFPRNHFEKIIIDEAHHATARSYRRVIEWFNEAKILGVTATPCRGDGVGMHNVFDSVAHDKMQLAHSISEGWLVPVRQQIVEIEEIHLERVGLKRGGDFADGELEAEMIGEDDITVHKVAAALARIANGRRTIVFAAGKEHARKLTEALNSEGKGRAELIIEDTLQAKRLDITARLKSGETTFLVNVDVATEGFDVPDVEIVAMCRATKSMIRYAQATGRATRPLAGIVDGPQTPEARRQAIAESAKPHCLILDFVGSSREVKIVTLADVLAGKDISDEDLHEAALLARDAGDECDMEEMLQKAIENRKEKERLAREEEERMASHRASSIDYSTEDVSIFAGPTWQEELDSYRPEPEMATEGQVKVLCRAGWDFDAATSLTKRRASGVIGKLFNQTPGPDFQLSFGKHSGTKVKNLPAGYRKWLEQQNWLKKDLRKSLDIVAGRVAEPELEDAPF